MIHYDLIWYQAAAMTEARMNRSGHPAKTISRELFVEKLKQRDARRRHGSASQQAPQAPKKAP